MFCSFVFVVMIKYKMKKYLWMYLTNIKFKINSQFTTKTCFLKKYSNHEIKYTLRMIQALNY